MDCLTGIQKDLQRCIGFVLLLPSSAVQHWLNDLPYLSLLTLVIALHVRMERKCKERKAPSCNPTIVFRQFKFYINLIGIR